MKKHLARILLAILLLSMFPAQALAAKASISLGGNLGFLYEDGSVTLDDCESFHRRVLKYAQDIDYDYMEVTSPGADRPLKTERDFERALGQNVEIRFYRQMDGQKQLTGRLTDFDAESVTVDAGAGAMRIARADAALIRMTLDDEELASPLFDELERAAQEQETQTQDGGESVT